MDETICLFEDQFVPLEDAKIGVMTHAFLYGTACFEGSGAYWSEEEEELLIFRQLEHYQRLRGFGQDLGMSMGYTPEELCQITVDLLKRDGFKEDMYLRPVVYKKTEAIGVRLTGIEDGFLVFAVPFGEYLGLEQRVAGSGLQLDPYQRQYDPHAGQSHQCLC